MGSEIEILVPDIEGWTLYKCSDKSYEDHIRHVPFVYGEHIKGCYQPFNKETPGLGWEWWDAKLGKEDRCWKCGGVVPKEIVALVVLMNWKEMDKSG